MRLVTIVSDELSKEEVQDLQKEADNLTNNYNYNAHAVMHYLGLKRNISASLYSKNGRITMNCRYVANKQ